MSMRARGPVDGRAEGSPSQGGSGLFLECGMTVFTVTSPRRVAAVANAGRATVHNVVGGFLAPGRVLTVRLAAAFGCFQRSSMLGLAAAWQGAVRPGWVAAGFLGVGVVVGVAGMVAHVQAR